MTIEGLKSIANKREVNLVDEVGSSVEALDRLGLIEDYDLVLESVTKEYRRLLNQGGKTGELFIQLPESAVTLDSLINVIQGHNYFDKKPVQVYVYRQLWMPDHHQNSNDGNQILNDSLDYLPHACLAVYNHDCKREPLLHFLNQPFSLEFVQNNEQKETQLDSIDQAIKDYKINGHNDFFMTPLSARGILFIALTRLIKGQRLPLEWGYMNDATLRCKKTQDSLILGKVTSIGGNIHLTRSIGMANPQLGVGLSIKSRN